ncbi:hypothetical protein J6590_046107 [Homalodisca vitripennis]|nr:hypothetical protein J6590_046107 [Homalodisca vitripennis]
MLRGGKQQRLTKGTGTVVVSTSLAFLSRSAPRLLDGVADNRKLVLMKSKIENSSGILTPCAKKLQISDVMLNHLRQRKSVGSSLYPHPQKYTDSLSVESHTRPTARQASEIVTNREGNQENCVDSQIFGALNPQAFTLVLPFFIHPRYEGRD